MATLAALFVGISILLIVLAIPLIKHWVKPNWIYGFRVPRTVNNPDIWYPANEYAGKWMVAWGVIMLIVSAGLPLVPGMTVDLYSIIITVVTLIFVPLMLIMSFRYLNTL